MAKLEKFLPVHEDTKTLQGPIPAAMWDKLDAYREEHNLTWPVLLTAMTSMALADAEEAKRRRKASS
jgi:hypothetical protein